MGKESRRLRFNPDFGERAFANPSREKGSAVPVKAWTANLFPLRPLRLRAFAFPILSAFREFLRIAKTP